MSWGLGCMMEKSLEASMYDPEALKPAGFVDMLYSKEILFPSGPGHQSVVYMPVVSDILGLPTLATAIHTNLAVTSGSACFESLADHFEGWVESVDLENLDAMADWSVDAKDFFATNEPYNLSQTKSERLAVSVNGQLHYPAKKMLLPNSKNYFDTAAHFSQVTEKDQFIPAFRTFAQNAQCLLIFDEDLPLWPSCNALDNGQFARTLAKLKYELKSTIGHKLGTRYDMSIEEITLVTNAYDNIVEQRYMNAITDFTIPSLDDVPKQCFVICYCSKTNKAKQVPIALLPEEDCIALYGEERCNSEMFGTVTGTVPKEPTIASPLLCAENGSIAYRGLLSSVDESSGHYNFAVGDYHLLAMAAWQDWANQKL